MIPVGLRFAVGPLGVLGSLHLLHRDDEACFRELFALCFSRDLGSSVRGRSCLTPVLIKLIIGFTSLGSFGTSDQVLHHSGQTIAPLCPLANTTLGKFWGFLCLRWWILIFPRSIRPQIAWLRTWEDLRSSFWHRTALDRPRSTCTRSYAAGWCCSSSLI